MNKSGFLFPLEENSKGSTLIELGIVLAIVVIVGAIVATGYGFLSAERVKSASRELFGDLQWIKHSSVTQGPDRTVPLAAGVTAEEENKAVFSLSSRIIHWLKK
jgi:Tfp pilus assembly protein FimT